MLHEPCRRHHWQLCRHFHQPYSKHRTAWQRLSHQFRVLRYWSRSIPLDLEETV